MYSKIIDKQIYVLKMLKVVGLLTLIFNSVI